MFDINNLEGIFNFFNSNLDSDKIQFLTKYEVNARDISIADICQKTRQFINEERGMMSIDVYRRGSKDVMLDFMSCLTENCFSKFLVNKGAVNARKVEVISPAVCSYLIDKNRDDFIMKLGDKKIEFDLKSQYFKSSTNSLNINKKTYDKCISDFYIAALIRNNNKDYKNFMNVNSIYFFFVPKKYIENHATLKFGKSYFYAIDMKRFIEAMPNENPVMNAA